MINFSDIEKGNIKIHENEVHSVVKEYGAACGALLKVHPEFNSVYSFQSDLYQFQTDGIYNSLSDLTSTLSDQFKTTKTTKFGNVEGTFYVTMVGFDIGIQRWYFAFLSKIDPDTNDLSKLATLKEFIKNNQVDIPTVLEHANNVPEKVFSEYQLYSFSIETLDDDALFELIVIIFNESVKKSGLNIDMSAIVSFLIFIRDHYNNVPYHNWRHATDATQFVYYMISNPKVTEFLQGIDIFAVVFSAICHDVGHNGRTNVFHRQVNSEYAQEAGPDQPPLEFHHQKYALEQLYANFPKIVENFNDEQNRVFKHFVSQIILATDMSKHKDYVTAINDAVDKFDGSEPMRLLACQALMKIADLSNTCRPFAESALMAAKLQEEWFCQGDDERALGFEVTKGYDRNNKGSLPQGQIGFYTFVTKALLNSVHMFFKTLDDCIEQFNSNLAEWEQLAKQ